MDRLSLRLAMALVLEAAPSLAVAVDSDNLRDSTASSPPSQKSRADDSANWQGYPNKALREPINCPKRTWKRVKENTLLELFANNWHDQPEPSSASDLQKVRVQRDEAARFPHRRYRSVPESGYAEIFALIGADGSVVEAHVVCSSDPDFHDVALTAARKSTYTPARVAGNPIESIVRRPYLFMSSNR